MMRWMRHAKRLAVPALLAVFVVWFVAGPRPAFVNEFLYRTSGGLVGLGDKAAKSFLEKSELEKRYIKANTENVRLGIENHRLREELRRGKIASVWIQKKIPNPIMARIIAREPLAWNDEIIVDRGTRNGVRNGYIALDPKGLVGRVVSVKPHSATIRLIISRGASTSCRLKNSGTFCIIRGDGAGMGRIEYVSRHSRVTKGDGIVTSGLGIQYPADIPIGYVTRVNRKTPYLTAGILARTAVDFGDLRYVYIARGQ